MSDLATGFVTNGHDKVFDIKKADDPLLSRIVPEARRRVCQNTKIPESARMFFCWLTDISLLFGAYIRRGVVKFSDGDLAARFKVSDKTIRNWKRWVESTGEVWLTEKWMKNSFPQTVYNITAIVGQATLPLNAESEDGGLADTEVFSSNRRRKQGSYRDPATGLFARRGTPPRVTALPVAESTPQISEEIPPSEKILPPTTEIDCRPPRQIVSAHHGNSLPLATANGCRLARKTIAAVGGNDLPQSAANGCRSPRKTVADNSKAIGRETVPKEVLGTPPSRSEWQKRLKKMFPRELEALRADLLKQKARLPLNDPQHSDFDSRIEAIDVQLYGGKVPAAKKPVATAKAAKPQPKPATEEETLDGARYLVSINKMDRLSEAQKAALAKVGEL